MPWCPTFGIRSVLMADTAAFISAPPGLTLSLTDGTRLPIVAFRVEGYDLIPYYLEKDGSTGGVSFEVKASAAWLPSAESTSKPTSGNSLKFT